MREREARQQRECPLRFAEAFFAPARVRQSKVMTPVVAFKRDRTPGGGWAITTSVAVSSLPGAEIYVGLPARVQATRTVGGACV